MHPLDPTVKRMNLHRDIRDRDVVEVVEQHHCQADSIRAYFYSKKQASALRATNCKVDCGLTLVNLID